MNRGYDHHPDQYGEEHREPVGEDRWTDNPAAYQDDPRVRRVSPRRRPATGDGHVKGVDASPLGLMRDTLLAAAAGLAILVFFWLPAEYGIDPSRVGSLMGLTQMGEIKRQLNAEAVAEDAATQSGPVSSSDMALAARLDAIEARISELTGVVEAALIVGGGPLPTPPVVETTPAETTAAQPDAPFWRDEVSYTLAPGQGVEVKLVMNEGAAAQFEWTANGGVLNHDTHGDGNGQNVMYERGRSVPGQQGELVAQFTGNHGWFWRNRTEAPITFDLRARGDYIEMRAP